MRLFACGLGLVLVLPAALAAPMKMTGNLLVNGSFEDGPDEVGDFKSLDRGSDEVKGWKVTRGQIDLIGNFWASADGKRSLDLHGSPGYGGVEQTFKTRKGTRYKVELKLASTPTAGKRNLG